MISIITVLCEFVCSLNINLHKKIPYYLSLGQKIFYTLIKAFGSNCLVCKILIYQHFTNLVSLAGVGGTRHQKILFKNFYIYVPDGQGRNNFYTKFISISLPLSS